MRLLFISTLYPPYIIGGAEISTQLLCEALVKAGHNVSVITTTNETSYTDEINGVHVHYIKQKNIYWKYPSREKKPLSKLVFHTIDIYNFLYVNEIKRIIFNLKPDIIHTQNLCGISTFIWDLAEKIKIPLVHTLRDYYLMCPKQSMTTKNGISCTSQCRICYVYSVPKRRLSAKVNAVVGISKFILNKHLDNGYFKNSLTSLCIANSVKPACLIKDEKKYKIGYIGRISEEKGVEIFIEAFIKAGSSKYKLEIAGSGKEKYVNYLKGKYSSEKISFLGNVSADGFYNKIDLLVVPSIWDEPFGRVVIESYSYGVPVFVSNMGGLPELVKEYTGRVFSIESANELTSLLTSFFNDELTFDKKRILCEASRYYTEESIALQYEKLYDNLLAKMII